jgi:hypothetical protein
MQWLWSLSINWDAVSAGATVAATIVALFLPIRMARREWTRQDQIRESDSAAVLRKLADAQREVCSAVDRVLSYREAAIALFDSAPVYSVGIEAIERINFNVGILLDTLDILKTRSGLSHGTVYAAVAATRIAEATLDETGKVLLSWGTGSPGWAERKVTLSELETLAVMAKERTDGVRAHYGLEPSHSAGRINSKYLPLAASIKAAIAADSGEPSANLSTSYY